MKLSDDLNADTVETYGFSKHCSFFAMKQKANANDGEEEKKEEEESKEPSQGEPVQAYDGLIHYFKDADGVW